MLSLWLRRFIPVALVLGCLGALGLSANSAQAATYTVTSLNDSGDGTLREAITDANADPDQTDIVFADGLAGGTLTLTEALPQVTTSLSILNPAAQTITLARSSASGTADFRILVVEGGAIPDTDPNTPPTGPTVALQGLTLTNGITANPPTDAFSASGGGLYTRNSTVSLTNCILSNNTARAVGGGLFNSGGAVTLTNCTLSSNVVAGDDPDSDYGGGVFSYGAKLTLLNSTVSGNTASFGGGLFNRLGSLVTITNSTFSNNTATSGDSGGGLYNEESTVNVTNSSFVGNTADYGGGLYNDGGTATIATSTFSGNTANSYGGGLVNVDGMATLSGCTVTGNTAPADQGSGIVVSDSGETTTSTTLSNSIVADNTNSDLDIYPGASNTFVSKGYNLVGTTGTVALTSFTQAGDKTGVTSAQLKLGKLANNGGPTQTIALQPGSLAFNAGNPDTTSLPTYDQRGEGYPRVSGGRVDVGAYEAQALTVQGTVYNAVARKGLNGIRVQALTSDNTVAAQTLTDDSGHYSLILIPGAYTLAATQPNNAAFRFTATFTNPITLTTANTGTGTGAASYDFRAIGIGGRIISPSNVGISGVTVNLYAQSDTARATPLATSTSDAQGFFSLDNVAQGTWIVVPVSPTDAYVYTPTSRTITVNDKSLFTSFTAAARNFVTGKVYNAVALNGLSGITIKAVKNGTSTVAGQTVTDAQGNYSLSLVPGIYNITAKRVGDATLRLLPLFTNPVTTKTTTTICQFRAIGIGGRIISPSNVGISGVTVNLYAQSDTALKTPLVTSTSDAQGFFSLDNVGQGTWLVAPVAPMTYTYTPATRLIQVANVAVFTSFKASVKSGAGPRSVAGGPRSAIVLSVASVNAQTGTLTLKFTGPLDAASVAELAHYGVEVDGVTVNVEDASLSGGDTIVLTLPEGAFMGGSQIAVGWEGVLDTHGLPLQGSTTLSAS